MQWDTFLSHWAYINSGVFRHDSRTSSAKHGNTCTTGTVFFGKVAMTNDHEYDDHDRDDDDGGGDDDEGEDDEDDEDDDDDGDDDDDEHMMRTIMTAGPDKPSV